MTIGSARYEQHGLAGRARTTRRTGDHVSALGGRAGQFPSPCQGEGHGFESRRPLQSEVPATTPFAKGLLSGDRSQARQRGHSRLAVAEVDRSVGRGLQATATATVPSGNAYLYDGNTPGKPAAQKLILAQTATLKTTVSARAQFLAPGNLTVTKTIGVGGGAAGGDHDHGDVWWDGVDAGVHDRGGGAGGGCVAEVYGYCGGVGVFGGGDGGWSYGDGDGVEAG